LRATLFGAIIFARHNESPMPKTTPTSELDRLLERVGRHIGGVGIDRLLRSLRPKPSRRTLQRRLALLVEQRRLEVQGTGRSVNYRLPVITAKAELTEAADTVQATAETYVPLTADAQQAKAAVRRPLSARQPVGYRIELLEAYEPNVTFYLPEPLRGQLLGLGRSPVRVETQAAVAGTFARDILNRLLIDLSWASSRLEGNTYTRLDTERLIEQGETAAGKDAFETQMILNHKAAIEYLVLDVEHARVTRETLLALHALLSDGLLADPSAGGRLRDRAVEIAGSVYRPLALPQRLEALFSVVVERAAAIEDPFEQSFFLMVHLPLLQPFEDMNKRVSRLAANIPFIRANLSPLSFIDVPERAYIDGTLAVYELNDVSLLRDVFVWAYERSCQQYVAIRSQLVAPDLFRLRYRVALGETMRALVKAQQAATPARVRRLIPGAVSPPERDEFVRLVLGELQALHAGNAVRFGLRPLEVQAWKASLSRRRNSA
jgi:Fic/DOC family